MVIDMKTRCIICSEEVKEDQQVLIAEDVDPLDDLSEEEIQGILSTVLGRVLVFPGGEVLA